MTAPAYATASAVLRRAGLLAAVLALIAGIFSMHVLTTAHALHSPAPSAGVQHGPAHATHHAPDPSAATETASAPEGVQTVKCVESGNCASMHAMAAGCTPSAKAGSLTAPLPGTAILSWNTGAGDLTSACAQWSYSPSSPSPGELCISRT